MSVDFSAEINNFLNAELGEEVRGSLVTIAEALEAAINAQLNTVTNDLTDTDPNAAAQAGVIGAALAKCFVNLGTLPSGAISSISQGNSFYALVNSNTYSDYPDEEVKNAFVGTIHHSTMWMQILITYATAAADPKAPGHVWIRSGANQEYGAWIRENPDLSDRLKIMPYDGTEAVPVAMYAERDTPQFCSYIATSWITETLNNIDKASSIIKFGSNAKDNAAVFGVERSTLRSFVYSKNTNDSTKYDYGVENCATVKLTSFSKKMIMYGDSITWGRDGDYTSGQEGYRTVYTIPSIIQRNLGIQTINYGVSYQGYMPRPGGGTITAYEEIQAHDNTDADYFVLAWGVNDWSRIQTNGTLDPAKLGTYLDTAQTTGNTLMKEVYKCVRSLYYANPFSAKPVQVMIVKPWNGLNEGEFPSYKYGNATYSALIEEIGKFCDYYGIPYIGKDYNPINGFSIGGILGSDGVHPSAAGYKLLGNWLSGEIGKIIG